MNGSLDRSLEPDHLIPKDPQQVDHTCPNQTMTTGNGHLPSAGRTALRRPKLSFELHVKACHAMPISEGGLEFPPRITSPQSLTDYPAWEFVRDTIHQPRQLTIASNWFEAMLVVPTAKRPSELTIGKKVWGL
jgi:hypothetical protein